ncbi:hypothetical protein NB526_20000 [Vibrio alginolyticus]|uniref:hypothetical protein n=1 Tax=Vibrio alginolyticus TaxID=663 RepID=UPI001A2741BE|nr:hypothetical protein [Vibrio alginolyticus]MCR9392665.1 hypothetical protein [Vibrio alginolyticus]HAS8502917.1 hypothetical protein [Vibrio vulnificus]
MRDMPESHTEGTAVPLDLSSLGKAKTRHNIEVLTLSAFVSQPVEFRWLTYAPTHQVLCYGSARIREVSSPVYPQTVETDTE